MAHGWRGKKDWYISVRQRRENVYKMIKREVERERENKAERKSIKPSSVRRPPKQNKNKNSQILLVVLASRRRRRRRRHRLRRRPRCRGRLFFYAYNVFLFLFLLRLRCDVSLWVNGYVCVCVRVRSVSIFFPLLVYLFIKKFSMNMNGAGSVCVCVGLFGKMPDADACVNSWVVGTRTLFHLSTEPVDRRRRVVSWHEACDAHQRNGQWMRRTEENKTRKDVSDGARRSARSCP